jgi:hemolysin-activating ACP:hemolysin acyltransferase
MKVTNIRHLGDDDLRVATACQRYSIFGCMLALLSDCDYYRKTPYTLIAKYTMNALQKRQIRCFFSDTGLLIGGIIWAWTTKEVTERLHRDVSFPRSLHASEWKEGNYFYILDLVARNESLKQIISEMSRREFTQAHAIAWTNIKRSRTHITKLHTQDQCVSPQALPER